MKTSRRVTASLCVGALLAVGSIAATAAPAQAAADRCTHSSSQDVEGAGIVTVVFISGDWVYSAGRGIHRHQYRMTITNINGSYDEVWRYKNCPT